MIEINKQWEELKSNLPIGYKFYGEVASIKHFGVFVNVGYAIIDGYQLSGLIDIVTKSDLDSSGLPIDNSLWPHVGQQVYCKVISYREGSKEVDLRLVNK
jgi:ribosomal protein S1